MNLGFATSSQSRSIRVYVYPSGPVFVQQLFATPHICISCIQRVADIFAKRTATSTLGKTTACIHWPLNNTRFFVLENWCWNRIVGSVSLKSCWLCVLGGNIALSIFTPDASVAPHDIAGNPPNLQSRRNNVFQVLAPSYILQRPFVLLQIRHTGYSSLCKTFPPAICRARSMIKVSFVV